MEWYLVGFLVTWFVLALYITIAHYDQDNLVEIILNVSGTCIASLIWPLTVIGIAMTFIIQYIGRRYKNGNTN